jgi:hypothetical protein
MLFENRKSYPMSIYIRLKLQGILDRPSFESSYEDAIQRHPLLQAKIRKERSRIGRKRWTWIIGDAQESSLQWLLEESVPHHPIHIDLETTSPLRAWISGPTDSPLLTLHFHHSAADGAGIVAFLRDLLLGYAKRRDRNITAELPTLDESKLLHRGSFGITLRKLPKILLDQLTGSIWCIRFALHRPEPVVPVDRNTRFDELVADYSCIISRSVSPLVSREYRLKAKSKSIKLNDQIVADFLNTMVRWRTQEKIPQSNKWIRMCIPMNERSVEDGAVPACNIVSMGFLDRRPSECLKPAKLLKSIQWQMGVLKRKRLGLTVILTMLGGRYIPGAFAQITHARKCRSTCVLSNMGEPFAGLPLATDSGKLIVGDVRLENIEIVSPLRPLTQAAFVVFSYANQLHLTGHFDHHHVDSLQAERWMSMLIETMEATAASH